jgi:arylsulfatase A-like enzyme
MLSAVDDGVGAILAKLREHNLEEDTLVIFISDNGGPTLGNASLNTPLRGHKGDTFEGGIRVPFMLQWKGRVPAGATDDRMVIQLDLLPTILEAAGAERPASPLIDGVDLLPYLTGQKNTIIHETLYWRFGPRRAIRSGDWKLQWNGDVTPRLYDLAKDVGEQQDVAAANPQIVQRLLTAYAEWDAQLMEPRWPGRLEGTGGDGPVDAASAHPARQPRGKS